MVPTSCRDRLAKITGTRACRSMDADRERPICKVTDDSDIGALIPVAGISGMEKVCKISCISYS